MMNSFFIYILQSSICMLAFYLVFEFLLKNDTHFQLKRAYLLLSLLSSLVIPQIHFAPPTQASLQQSLEVVITPIQNVISLSPAIEVEKGSPLSLTIFYLYLLVACILLSRFVYHMTNLITMIKKGSIEQIARLNVIYTGGHYPTSSFFKYILWDNTSTLSQKEAEKIIQHEQVHVKELHSLDNLFLELLKIVFWLNPLIYLYSKKLKETHEFIADEKVLIENNEYSAQDYQVLISKQTLNHLGYELSNNFNMSNLKKRITMITKERSRKINRIKALVFLPTLLGLSIVFSSTRVESANSSSLETDEAPKAQASFVGGRVAMMNYLKDHITYPEDVKKEGAEGTSYIEITITREGQVENVLVAKSSGHESLDKEAVRVISGMPNWKPGHADGKPIVSKLFLPIKFKLSSSKTFTGKYRGKNLYVSNPYSDDGESFLVTKVKVNDKIYNSSAINASAFEIDLSNLKDGDSVSVELYYDETNKSKPKLLNPEAIKL